MSVIANVDAGTHVMGGLLNEEAALLARAGAGDASAFRLLASRHLSDVYKVARRILADDAEAEDVAQEVMLRLWRSAGKFQAGAGGVAPWLRRVAANESIDRLRKRQRFDVTDDLLEQSTEPAQVNLIYQNDIAQRIRAALDGLPDRQRVALVLFHFEDMGQRDVADVLQVSEDAVEGLLARARRKLKDILKDEWRELLSLPEQV